MRRALLGPATALVLLLSSACSASVSGGDPQVPVGELEEKVSAALEETVGRAPDSVDCPDPLPAEVGAEVRCTLEDGGTLYVLTAGAAAVDGTDVSIQVEVDQEPASG